MSIKERLRVLIETQNTSVKRFAELADIPLRSIHNYLSGEREPSAEVLIKIANITNVNLNWLLLDKGEMFIDNELERELTKNELNLLEQFRTTNNLGKEIISETITTISNKLK
ncbi:MULTISPECIES: helix-turn-helix domain-containing protein [unclassified Lonepinella]|uniref:helix-turn-helix domain-containing protein n=1 Tax=unclassified Lonepinella TaxID=2642006 RepID=UPI0036DA22BA